MLDNSNLADRASSEVGHSNTIRNSAKVERRCLSVDTSSTNSACLSYHSNSYPVEAASSSIPKSCTQTYSFIPFVTNNSRPSRARLDKVLNPSIRNNSLPDDALRTQTQPSWPLVINVDASCRLCAMHVTGPSCEGENKCALLFIRCVESRGQ